MLVQFDEVLGSGYPFAKRARIEVVSGLFSPWDPWARVFRDGLQIMLNNGWLTGWVHEVGAASGTSLLGMVARGIRVSFSDYHEDVIQAIADANVRRVLRRSEWDRILPIVGSVDLLGGSNPVVRRVNAVIACIPQVPHQTINLRQGENLAHYYNPLQYESDLHALGLGLNDVLLKQAKSVLQPRGKVVLCLGGRPGMKRLIAMFIKRGYRYVYRVHEAMVAQDPSTCLQPLADMEVGGERFEFFSDPLGRHRITARQAEFRRVNSMPVFHRVYVIVGEL